MSQTSMQKTDALLNRIDTLLAETTEQARASEALLQGSPAINILRQARLDRAPQQTVDAA